MAEQTALLPISGGEDPERLADVIFVHDLDGDARSTWHPKDQPKHFWPAWLGEEMPQLGVWSLTYAVSASAWKGHSMPLVDRANNVLDLFALEDIGQRPLALICHSLGDLLMKQVLRTARDALDPQWQAIVEHTQLMVFLSTPHSGANMASWITYLGTLLRLTVSVEELEAHHPRLRELNIWYRDRVAALGIRISTVFVNGTSRDASHRNKLRIGNKSPAWATTNLKPYLRTGIQGAVRCHRLEAITY